MNSTIASAPAANALRVIESIPYPTAAKGERCRSLDLYLPATVGKKTAVMIFIHGGFWLLSDDEYRIGP